MVELYERVRAVAQTLHRLEQILDIAVASVPAMQNQTSALEKAVRQLEHRVHAIERALTP